MNITGSTINNILIVSLDGEIDHSTAGNIKDKINEGISKHKINKLIIDFSMVSFMDSSGIGMIIGRYKELSLLKGEVVLCSVNKYIEKILNLSGIYKIIQIFKTQDEAIKYFSKEN